MFPRTSSEMHSASRLQITLVIASSRQLQQSNLQAAVLICCCWGLRQCPSLSQDTRHKSLNVTLTWQCRGLVNACSKVALSVATKSLCF